MGEERAREADGDRERGTERDTARERRDEKEEWREREKERERERVNVGIFGGLCSGALVHEAGSPLVSLHGFQLTTSASGFFCRVRHVIFENDAGELNRKR